MSFFYIVVDMLSYLLAPKLCQYFYRLYSLWCFGSHLQRYQVAGEKQQARNYSICCPKDKVPQRNSQQKQIPAFNNKGK